jgi:hypothetical protein
MADEQATGDAADDHADWPHPTADVPGDWVRRDRAFRGISVRLAVHYLGNLGGEVVDAANGGDEDGEATAAGDGAVAGSDEATAEAVVAGDDWRATLSSTAVGVGPTVSLTEVRIVFVGDPERLDAFIDRFAQKAMRAGG